MHIDARLREEATEKQHMFKTVAGGCRMQTHREKALMDEKWCSSRWVVVAVGVPMLLTILCFSPCKISLYCGVRSVIGNAVRNAARRNTP